MITGFSNIEVLTGPDKSISGLWEKINEAVALGTEEIKNFVFKMGEIKPESLS